MKDLADKFALFDKPEVNAEAFFLCQERPGRLTVYRTIFNEETLRDFRGMQFRAINREMKKSEEVINYDPALNPDRHVVFKLGEENIDEAVNLRAAVKDVGTLPAFSKSTSSYSSIRAVVVRYTNSNGQHLFTVRKIDGRRVLQHRGKLALIFSTTTFSRFNDEILTLDEYVDGLLVDGTAYMFNRSNFEKALLFSKYIKEMATEAVAKMAKLKFLTANGQLEALIEDQHCQGKLCGLEEVGLLSSVTLSKIQKICKDVKKVLPMVGGKISLATKADAKLLLKVLHDDYLMSELTGARYDAHSKEKIS